MSENATPRPEALLRDALDHIKRVAQDGMQPTRRLDWIALRAKVALRGETWEPGMRDEPGNSRAELIEKNVKLREKLAAANARIAELEKENEALSKRVAYFEERAIDWDADDGAHVWMVETFLRGAYKTFAEAIDAAMSAKEKP